MDEYDLSAKEADVLCAIGDNPEATLTELAMHNLLTPSEVREAVSHLTDKRLVALKESSQTVRLTSAGSRIVDLRRQRQQTKRAPGVKSAIKWQAVPPADQDLDQAIEEELDRLG